MTMMRLIGGVREVSVQVMRFDGTSVEDSFGRCASDSACMFSHTVVFRLVDFSRSWYWFTNSDVSMPGAGRPLVDSMFSYNDIHNTIRGPSGYNDISTEWSVWVRERA